MNHSYPLENQLCYQDPLNPVMVSFAVWLTPTMVKILLAQSKLAHCLHLPQPPSSLSLLSFFRIEVYGAINLLLGFAGGSAVKNPCANAGDVGNAGWIPRSGRSPGVGNGNPLRNSCLENSIDRGAWLQSVGSIDTIEHMHQTYMYGSSNLSSAAIAKPSMNSDGLSSVRNIFKYLPITLFRRCSVTTQNRWN